MSTEELIVRGYELAGRLGLKITTHVSGGTFSLEKGFLKYLRETGRTDVRYLMQLGILDPQWVLIHGIHCTELDIEQMARVGCSFVYTPSSESIRGGGISPASNAQRAGVDVALGTDGPMVDYSVDMVEQMKVCALMQHVRHLDPTRMPVERTMEMATINAAKALGLEPEIGSLEAGKRADIAVFDLDQALRRRAAPAAHELRHGRQGQRRARGAGRRAGGLPRRHVCTASGLERRDCRGRTGRPHDPGSGRSRPPPCSALAAGLIPLRCTEFVMAGLVPAIHVLLVMTKKDVDARHKAGHDGA